ncbi:hypothetical protein [Salibacter halophilus]|uniref:Uncharacterized protein n=1 Tax=Salibacter halophilus TaxID=1803916 RepID=A0A6N6M8V2_9FLAO|nr:hypothetical protein [Salibacter halophilus]KAB1065194.1 hypothetical protein F3059_04365 [Salibacter halophilus]
MLTHTVNNGFESPLKSVSKLLGSSIQKFLTRRLKGLQKDLNEIELSITEQLEIVNRYQEYDTNDLSEFEKLTNTYDEVFQLFKLLISLIDEAKSDLTDKDDIYRDLVLLGNQLHDLNKITEKLLGKLSSIHDKILVKQSELSSSDILNDMWKDEGDLWDNFYEESKKS